MLVTVKRCYLYDKDFLLAARRSQTKAYAPIIYRTFVQTIPDYRGGKRHENKDGKGGNVVRAHRRRKKLSEIVRYMKGETLVNVFATYLGSHTLLYDFQIPTAISVRLLPFRFDSALP